MWTELNRVQPAFETYHTRASHRGGSKQHACLQVSQIHKLVVRSLSLCPLWMVPVVHLNFHDVAKASRVDAESTVFQTCSQPQEFFAIERMTLYSASPLLATQPVMKTTSSDIRHHHCDRFLLKSRQSSRDEM